MQELLATAAARWLQAAPIGAITRMKLHEELMLIPGSDPRDPYRPYSGWEITTDLRDIAQWAAEGLK